MWLAEVFGMVLPLAILGLIVWAIVRVVGQRNDTGADVDHAASVRRLFVYGLLFATLMMSAGGVVLVVQELVGTSPDRGDDRSALALGLAFLIVAGPTYVALLRHVRQRLEGDTEAGDERRSFAWLAYLNLSLIVSLIVTVVTAQQMLESVFGVDDFEVDSIAPVIVWAAVWAVHWFRLKAEFGLPGDAHLAAGSLTGLITSSIGIWGLLFAAGDKIYSELVEQVPRFHREAELGSPAITASIGLAVWAFHWLGHYRQSERTPLWHVYVVLVGGLGGLVTALGAAATAGYWTLVWFVGDASAPLPSLHFEDLPAAMATLFIGAAVWQYHRFVLQRQRTTERTEPLRTYDYLMAAAGLVATVVAITLVLVGLLELLTDDGVRRQADVANRMLLALTLATVGGPLWWLFWARINRAVEAEPGEELRSAVRRTHLIGVFGVGGVVTLVSLISVLFIGLEDLLGGRFDGGTIHSLRVGLALIVAVSGIAWYHLGVFRSDRDALDGLAPPESTPQAVSTHLILVAPRGANLAHDLAAATGAEVTACYRSDRTAMPDIDLSDLVARVQDSGETDLLVLVDADGSTLIPVDPPSSWT